jgi:hydroxymethylpyrimidine pyrophosphatase-like HAD family hydrolase
MSRRFDAVICDIDGCLSPESSAPFDTSLLARIAEHNRLAQDAGDRPVVTVCSGRPEPFAEAMTRLMGNRTIPAIAENGVWLFHPVDNGWDRDPAIKPEHLQAVREAEAWVSRELGPSGVVMQPGKVASISLYHRDTAYLRTLEPRVRDEFQRRGWPLRVSMTWLYMNCDLTFISKSTALDRFVKHTKLAKDRLAGIGDTPSDLAIAEHVSWFACPANADVKLKPHADYISPKAEAAGVLDILDRLPT